MWRPLVFSVVLLALVGGAAVTLFPNAWFAMHLWFEPAPTALPLPVEGLDLRHVHDSWGNPRAGGRRHEGIDLFAPRGTPVRSATHGIVWRVGEDRLGGNVVLVLGPGRQVHYYAHLDRSAPITRGERVAAGTVLGYVGNTGNARGGPTHLHYGIYAPRVAGTASGAIDPYPLLVAGGRASPRGPYPARAKASG